MDFISAIRKLSKLFYWPICRAYAKYLLGNKPADTTFRLLCSLQFCTVHHYWPNFRHPTSFTEKLWSKMLHDRDPRLPILCDKLKVRDFVAQKVGQDILVPLLWYGERPENIPLNDLPSKFVIKTNHGAGYYIIVKDSKDLNFKTTKIKLNQWLRENYCEDRYIGIEWGYKNIHPTILIEPLLEENGDLPIDYKFYCFLGRVEFLIMHFERLKGQRTILLDRDFQSPKFAAQTPTPRWTGIVSRPPNFDSMVHVAESLAKDFDFIRVDLYNIHGKIFFGELTPYPGGVGVKILPDEEDFVYGGKWNWKSN